MCSHLSGPFANHQAVALSKFFRVYTWNRFSSTSVASLWSVVKCRTIVYPKLSKSTCYYPFFLCLEISVLVHFHCWCSCAEFLFIWNRSLLHFIYYIFAPLGFRSLHMILLKFFLLTFPQWRNFQFCQELDKLGSSPRCSWCSLIHIFRYLPLVDYHCQGLGRCLLYRFHQ